MRTIFSPPRNSTMEIGEVYFWTATVYEWFKLFELDHYKTCLTDSLTYLHNANLIKVYGFRLCPNHMHMVWELLKMNGKDKPNASFTKYTAHKIIEDLKLHNPKEIEKYVVNEHDRSHRVWQRDPLAIKITSRAMLEQKLDYTHLNPLQPHWNLAKAPEESHFSSAGFYIKGKSSFPFLSHYMNRF